MNNYDKSKDGFISIGNKSFSLKSIVSTAGPKGLDVSNFFAESGHFLYDPGLSSIAHCRSSVSYIDGIKGILRYRGYLVSDLVKSSNYLDVSHMLIYGNLPNKIEREGYTTDLYKASSLVHSTFGKVIHDFGPESHPMSVLIGCMSLLAASEHDAFLDGKGGYDYSEKVGIKAIGTISGVTAAIIRLGLDKNYKGSFEKSDSWGKSFLKSALVDEEIVENKAAENAMEAIMILHADHSQNASTAALRSARSTEANPFACFCSALVSLWGSAHGGANEAVLNMLSTLLFQKMSPSVFVEKIKNKEAGIKLMGFGHRVYKNFDPRAVILKEMCYSLLNSNLKKDKDFAAMVDMATELEEIALKDEYFISRKLYPNVDFYSGIILRTLGIPVRFFTPIFAVSRSAGWAAQLAEADGEAKKICRPRQVYIGPRNRSISE